MLSIRVKGTDTRTLAETLGLTRTRITQSWLMLAAVQDYLRATITSIC